MNATTDLPLIHSRIIKTAPVKWKDLKFIQQEGFKDFSPESREKLRKSILNNNFIQPFYVWEDIDGIIYCLDGFHRILDLLSMEDDGIVVPAELPATFISCKDKQEAAKLVLLYSSVYAQVNEIGFQSFIENYELNMEDLAFEINLPEFPGIIMSSREAQDDDYEIPEEVKTDIVEGDLFQIGPHRLLCGSSTKSESWAKLLGDEKVDLVVTDPPYNVDYVGKTKKALTIENDKQSDEDFYTFLFDFYSALGPFTKPGGAWYVWHADSEGVNFRKAMVDAGIMLKQCLIWVKNSMVMGRQDYHWQHEPCLYGWKPGAAHNWYTDRKQTTVLNFDRPQRNDDHPTMKPVPLIGYQIGNSSKEGDIVADGFGGSGTAMVASHQLGMQCRMIELDPKYCQVIVDRMRRLQPDITILRNGQPYEAPLEMETA